MKLHDLSVSFVREVRVPEAVVFDLGNVLIRWDPYAAVAAGVGPDEARRFLAAPDFDFMAWNHLQDAGRSWDDGVAEVVRTHPHWAEHARAYRTHFAASLLGEVPGTAGVVRDLQAAGVRLLGLTNWSAELYPYAPATFDVLALLDDVVVSGREGVAKPDRRVFEIVAERAALPLDRLAFVDDLAGNVAAATALGMDGIVFTDAATLRADLAARGLPV
jgi:2-haloacid dehalogenase